MAASQFNVNLGGYQQVVAVTQQMINTSLENLFLKSAVGGTPIESIGNRDSWIDNLVLGAPTVVIRYSDRDPSHVIYKIHAQSGTYSAFKNKIAKKPDTWPIKDWVFAFPVDIGLHDLSDAEAVKFREQQNVRGDYSITKLVLNLKDPKISEYSASDSNFGGNEKNMNQYQFDALKLWMGSVVNPTADSPDSLQNADFANLGYLGNPTNAAFAASKAPTFLPNGTQFQTYPWKDPSGAQAAAAATGNSRLNYLCYMETTGKNTMPSGQAQWLPYTGNFTSGRIDQDGNGLDIVRDDMPLGSFVMTPGNFFDNYLLPKLSMFNQSMLIAIAKVSASCDWKSNYDLSVETWLGGGPDMKDSDYGFTKINKSDQTPMNMLATALFPGQNVWGFAKSYNPGEASDHVLATIAIACKASSSNYVFVAHKPGSNEITVKGVHSASYYGEVWRGIRDHAVSKADRADRDYNWGFTLVLQSVSDGGLQIKMQDQSANFNSTRQQDDLEYKIGGYGKWLDGQWADQAASLGNLEVALANDIGQTNQLVFPSSGVFWYDNPVLTLNSALMCTVRYKGAGEAFAPGLPQRANPDPAPAPSSSTAPQSDIKGKVDF